MKKEKLKEMIGKGADKIKEIVGEDKELAAGLGLMAAGILVTPVVGLVLMAGGGYFMYKWAKKEDGR